MLKFGLVVVLVRSPSSRSLTFVSSSNFVSNSVILLPNIIALMIVVVVVRNATDKTVIATSKVGTVTRILEPGRKKIVTQLCREEKTLLYER